MLVTIENKPSVRDPEGETIMRDLMIGNSYTKVKGVRVAKVLRVQLEAAGREEALEYVRRMCDDLRIYNPIVSVCSLALIEG